jgi:hypothetical protein
MAVDETRISEPFLCWPWFSEYLFHGVSKPSSKGKRDFTLDPEEPLDIRRITNLLKKVHMGADVYYKHKRHLNRGASAKAAADGNLSAESQDRAGRWQGYNARAQSYAFMPAWDVSRLHAGYDRSEPISQARACTAVPESLKLAFWQQKEGLNVLSTLRLVRDGLLLLAKTRLATEDSKRDFEEWKAKANDIGEMVDEVKIALLPLLDQKFIQKTLGAFIDLLDHLAEVCMTGTRGLPHILLALRSLP